MSRVGRGGLQRQNEKQRVVNELKANGYPESFIKSAGESSKTNTQPRTQENPKAYTPIPYVKGVSERVRDGFWAAKTSRQRSNQYER